MNHIKIVRIEFKGTNNKKWFGIIITNSGKSKLNVFRGHNRNGIHIVNKDMYSAFIKELYDDV
jgi:hypothetical protein